MASDLSFVEFVVDQFDKDCAVTYRKMFGGFSSVALRSSNASVVRRSHAELGVRAVATARAFHLGDSVEAADMFATILGRDDESLYREEAPEPRGQEC